MKLYTSNVRNLGFILLSLLVSSNCWALIGSELYDLRGRDEASFKAEAAQWTASSLISPQKYSLCNDTYLLGGYSILGHSTNQYFGRVYTDLPTHDEIEFSLTFWILDNWADGDYFQLQFDSDVISAWNFESPLGLVNICGGSSPDLASVTIKGKVSHSESSLTFRVISQLSHATSVQSFGLRDLRFNFVKTPSNILLTPVESSICALAPISLPASIPACECEGATYETFTNSGQCLPCDESCLICTGPSRGSCSACQNGFFLEGSTCNKCDIACGACDGSTTDDCLTCNEGYQEIIGDSSQHLLCLAKDPTFGVDSFLNAPLEENKLSFITVANLLQHSRFLDINMPPRLQLLSMSQGRSLLSLKYGSSMSEEMKSQFEERSIPFVFERAKIHSSFLVNFWQDFTTLGIIFVGVFISILLEITFSKVNWIFLREVSRTLRIMIAWNFCFVFLATEISNIIYYTYLELSTFSPTHDHYTNLSLIICLMVLLTMAGLVIQIRRTVKTVNSCAIVPQGSIDQGFVNLKRVWESSRVFYGGLNSGRFFGRNFYLIYLIRIGLPAVFSIALQKSPITQTVFQTALSVAIIGSILRLKPLRSKTSHIQLIIIEIIVFIVNFCLIMLAVLDTVSKEISETAIRFGDVVIIGNFCINLVILVFLPIKVFVGLKPMMPDFKASPRPKKILTMIRFVDLLIQQGGMGFEQIFRDKSLASYKKLITDIEANMSAVMERKPKKLAKKISRISPNKIAPSPFSTESKSTNFSRWNSSALLATDRDPNENGSLNHLLKSPRDGSVSSRTFNVDETGNPQHTNFTHRRRDDLDTIMTENEEKDMSFGDHQTTPRRDQDTVFDFNENRPSSSEQDSLRKLGEKRTLSHAGPKSIVLQKTVSNPEQQAGSLGAVDDFGGLEILQKAHSTALDFDGQTPQFKKTERTRQSVRSMSITPGSQTSGLGETKSSLGRARKCNHRQCNWYRKMCRSYFVWSPLRKHMNIPCALHILKKKPVSSIMKASSIVEESAAPAQETPERIIPGTIVLEEEEEKTGGEQ